MQKQVEIWIQGKMDLDHHMEDYFAKNYARTAHEWMEEYKIQDGRVHLTYIDSNDTTVQDDFPVRNLWEKM